MTRFLTEGAHLQDVVDGALGVLEQQRGQVARQQRAPPLQVHLVALRVQHLVVLPQLPPDVCARAAQAGAPRSAKFGNPRVAARCLCAEVATQ